MLELFKNADKIAGVPLAIMSVLALAIILERLFTLYRLSVLENGAFLALKAGLTTHDEAHIKAPEHAAAPVTHIMNTVMAMQGASEESLLQISDVALSMQRMRLRRYLSTLATIGSTAPFIGLFGTVLGVMHAFSGMSNLNGAELSRGISGALSATAIGLLVAIPSVMSYNFLIGRVQGVLLRIQSHVAQLIPLLQVSALPRRERVEV